jgi:anti-sigma B factor antagonist
MKLETVDLANGVTKISLSGRLDIQGALKIDGDFVAIAEGAKNIVVDLSEVTFLASLGIRTLIVGAKAAASNGGKLVLLNPQPNVEGVLRSSNVDTVMPIINDATPLATVFGA